MKGIAKAQLVDCERGENVCMMLMLIIFGCMDDTIDGEMAPDCFESCDEDSF